MATIVGPFGAISASVASAGASPSGYVSLGAFSAIDGSKLPNLGFGPVVASGTLAGMGIGFSGAISSPFVGGGFAANIQDLAEADWSELPNLSVGPGAKFYTNFSQVGYRTAVGYLYYQSSIISVTQKMNGEFDAYNSFESGSKGSHQLFAAMESAGYGYARVLEAIAAKETGYARVLLLCQNKETGKAIVLNAFELESWGQFNLELVSIVAGVNGAYYIQNPYSSEFKGRSRVLIGCTGAGYGLHGKHAAIQTKLVGYGRVTVSFTTKMIGKHGSSTSFTGMGMNGRSRIQNNSKAGYVAYVGQGGAPNFAAAPAAESADWPLDVHLAPPITGLLTYHIVIRKRDSHGLESQNQKAFIVTLDTAGNRVLSSLPALLNVGAGIDSNARVMVAAEYPDYLTADDPADLWRVWLNTDSINTSTDAPSVEIPVTQTRLLTSLSGYNPGAYNYKVALYRTEDDTLGPVSSGVVTVPAVPDEPMGVPGMANILES